MWYKFLYIALLSALFLNTDAASYLGVSMLTTVAFTPLLIAIGIRALNKWIKFDIKDHKNSLAMLVLTAIILLVKTFSNEDILRHMVNFTIIPIVIIPIAFSKIDSREKLIFRKAIMIFYLIECGVGILERLLKRRFFDTIFVSDRYDVAIFEQYDWQFRSTSLLGHPLENAMAVAVMMAFILGSSMTLNKKVLLFLLGYISLYCFNARGAILVSSLVLLPILAKLIIAKYSKYKFITISALLTSFAVGGYLLLSSSLSGRLLNSEKLFDSSGQERINVFSYLEYLSDDKLITGNVDNYKYLLDKLELVGIENGIITAILLFGFVFSIPLLILLFSFVWRKLQPFGARKRITVVLVFWGIGVMNPNLIDPTQWYILVFCLIAFKPKNIKRTFVVTKANARQRHVYRKTLGERDYVIQNQF